MCVRIVVDYEDTRFSNFAHEFVHKNENHFCLVSGHMGHRSNLLSKKRVENLVHCPFNYE